MTPSALRDALASIRWSQRGLAEVLGCDDRMVRRWAAGSAEIPPAVGEWLANLAKCHEVMEPPRNWKRRVYVARGAACGV
jgi:transcriptional regulator with XRE-family HTH domain